MPGPCASSLRSHLLGEPAFMSWDEFQNSERSSRNGNTLTCMIAAVLVFWVVMSVLKTSSTPRYMQHPYNPLYVPGNAIVASARLVTSLVSARTAGLKGISGVPPGLLDLAQCRSWLKVPVEGKPNVVVADCKDGNWKEMTEEDRKKVDDALHAFLDKTPNVILMVFAPWCPHCHKVMPQFVHMSQRAHKTPFCLVDAEAVLKGSFTQGDARMIHPLQYFPTFLVKKDGGAFVEKELTEVLEYAEGDAPVEEGVAESEEMDPSNDAPEVVTPQASAQTTQMLAQFF